jgi:hypothetical protein
VGVRALVALGERGAAIKLAESCLRQPADDPAIALACEEILLSSGLAEEAYARYAIMANQQSTNLATFRAIVDKYPQRPPATVLGDLVASTPGQEGKWFAAAKDAKLYDAAVELARRSPCDPRTLTRAARDHVRTEPGFAAEAGLLALHWLAQGYGYEVTAADVRAAYSHALEAAERIGCGDTARDRARQLVAAETAGGRLVAGVLGREVGVG